MKSNKERYETTKVVRVGLKREPGYIYYIDKEGDICRALQLRGRGRFTLKELEEVHERRKQKQQQATNQEKPQ